MSEAEDRALLRRFEPLLRFTRGERFFPLDTERYVRECSLWVHRPRRLPQCVIPEKELTLERLSEPRWGAFDAVYYLRFIEPLNIPDLAAYEIDRIRREIIEGETENVFRAGTGRLARVGYLSRFVDALFSITLLARGRVPGDTAAAAAIAYQRLQDKHESYQYYGRVVRRDGWLVLQYWFFYTFNNWRSGFFGVNDHEADWEMISLYLCETEDGDLQPEWVACAAHDFSGDDLRRHWDDPEVEKVGEHPVLYVAAGSHAAYFRAGEYLGELELPFLRPLVRLTRRLQSWWGKALREVQDEEDEPEHHTNLDIFRVPFVDYARGDGLSIGPGQARTWQEPLLLNPTPDWALHYRGLWGLYAQDPIAGENAPAGPLYDRDGTLRRSWYDPVGWAGLDKVPPSTTLLAQLREQRDEIEARQEDLRQAIAAGQRQLVGLGVEAEAMRGKPHFKAAYAAHQQKIASLSAELDHLRDTLGADESLRLALERYEARLTAGERWPRRAHIQRAHQPVSETELRMGRVAELWAAISIGLTLVAFVTLLLFSRQHVLSGLVVLLSLFIFIEAGFRRRLERLVSSVTNALALVAALWLLFEFFWEIVVLLALLTGIYLLFQNLRELWH